MIGSRTRISRSSMRQKATTGAPVRSDPKLGNAWACAPSRNAATESSSAAVTTPAAAAVDANLEYRLHDGVRGVSRHA
jgi:hypothetical protein